VCFQRIGGKLDAFAAKMQPLGAKKQRENRHFLGKSQKNAAGERVSAECGRPLKGCSVNSGGPLGNQIRGQKSRFNCFVAASAPLL
jgi:hypothetical protein